MATTSTQFTLTGREFPYIGIGIPAAQLFTNIPSGELIFVKEASITVAGAGEDQLLGIGCTLPRSFCYVLVESFTRIDGLDAADWAQAGNCNLTDSATQTDDRTSIPLLYENTLLAQRSTTIFQRNYVCQPTPTKIVVPRATDNANFNVEFFNPTVDGTVMTFKFYARLLKFDRNQAQSWQVNTPFYTR